MRNSPASRLPLRAVATICLVGLAAAGCSPSQSQGQNDTQQIVEGGAVPSTVSAATRPAGQVSPLSGAVSSIVPLGDDVIAIQSADTARITLARLRDGGLGAAKDVTIPARSAQMVAGSGNSVLVPGPDGLIRVSADGVATPVGEVGEITAAAELADGRILTGHTDGTVAVRDADGTEKKRLKSLTSIDQLIAAGDVGVAISRPDTVVASVYPDKREIGPNLRGGLASGEGAASAEGWAAVADTTGDGLQIFGTDPIRLHQYFPVGRAPWAVAIDPATKLVWVTLTGENRVVAVDVSSGTGKETKSFPTVSAPQSVVVTTRGDVIVGSAAGEGVQVIPKAQVDAARVG